MVRPKISKNTTLKLSVKKLNGIFQKSLGLIIFNKNTPIYFESRFGIHTFFLKKPITVVILDNNLKIKLIKNLKPWRVYFYNPRYKKIIEFPNPKLLPNNLFIDKKIEIVFK